MSVKKQKSFNGLVYKKAYKRLKLKPTERFIFQRLLGFLIRNEKPFPFSTTALSELTGYSSRTIVSVLSRLEYLRLIERTGMGKNRRFRPGSILIKIFATAQFSSKPEQDKNSTTAQSVRQLLNNCAGAAYSKTSSSLKLKECCPLTLPLEDRQNYDWYLKNPRFPMPKKLKYVGEWIAKNSPQT